ncbi:MAG: hypothetical protein HYV07_00660 [Deltaproteobacteria bacterium]|nr:hypothetical protein [Deltaproteobacteria bacterium]
MRWFIGGLLLLPTLAVGGCKGDRKTGVNVPMYPEAVFLRTGRKPIGDCSNVFFQHYTAVQDGSVLGKWYTKKLEEDPVEDWMMPKALPNPEDGTAVFRTENMGPGIDPKPVDCKKPARAVVVSSSKSGGEIQVFENVPNTPAK